MRKEHEELRGKYFTYCQWCKYDGNCELKHSEFLGLPPSGSVDQTPYPGHDQLDWAMSSFQAQGKRGTCSGRIKATGQFWYPLQCECSTVINSLALQLMTGRTCAKYDPILEANPENPPKPDPNYGATVDR